MPFEFYPTACREKITAISMLCEGSSIRSVERITGIHRDTVMRLGVRIGEGCQKLMDEKMRDLPCRLIQVDEVWGYVGMKQKTALRNRTTGNVGDVWTWVALDSETKLVPTFAVGDRSKYMANTFIEDLASRLSHRVQLSSDALRVLQFREVQHCDSLHSSDGRWRRKQLVDSA